jgi:hypothetical protein
MALAVRPLARPPFPLTALVPMQSGWPDPEGRCVEPEADMFLNPLRDLREHELQGETRNMSVTSKAYRGTRDREHAEIGM